MNAPDLTKRVIGYREFRVDRRTGLHSRRADLHVGARPQHRALPAEPPHEPPSVDCRCGFYAWHDIPFGWLACALCHRWGRTWASPEFDCVGARVTGGGRMPGPSMTWAS